LYTSWFYHAPTRSLFDCGEGCSSFLGNKVFAVENIFISHGHLDHVSGLPSFLGIRQKGRGDHEKPLTVFYPRGCREVENLRKYWESLWYTPLTYSLNWVEVEPDTSLPNGVVSFQTQHCRSLSLGYKVIEARKRLKPHYVGRDIGAMIRANAVDRNDLMEDYTASRFVYSLDSNSNLDPKHLQGAEEWIADTTFLNRADRDSNSHATIGEMVSLAIEAKVKRIYCAHFSPRYDAYAIDKAIERERKSVYDKQKLEIIPVYFDRVHNF
jgi:ribonuclease Z